MDQCSARSRIVKWDFLVLFWLPLDCFLLQSQTHSLHMWWGSQYFTVSLLNLKKFYNVFAHEQLMRLGGHFIK